jgi:hypothetical protein
MRASLAPGVVACNMAEVPLPDASVDVAVFSLSLMGTDYGLFLEEAHRVRIVFAHRGMGSYTYSLTRSPRLSLSLFAGMLLFVFSSVFSLFG